MPRSEELPEGCAGAFRVDNRSSRTIRSIFVSGTTASDDDYRDRLDEGVLPAFRGIGLNGEDVLRRAVIQSLMCHFEVAFDSFDKDFGIDFSKHFAVELAELGEMERAGLLRIEARRIVVLSPGRMLVRAISMVFDAHLRANRPQNRYSKVI